MEVLGRRAALTAALLAGLMLCRWPAVGAWTPFVHVTFTVDDGSNSGLLHVSGTGPFSVDPSRLSVLARPFAKPDAAPRPLEVNVGAVQSDATSVVIPATISTGLRPGIYAVEARAAQGFARTADGTDMALAPSGERATDLRAMSWPRESNGDALLAQLRYRYMGRDVYGYGGIAISCPPDWTKFYGPSTPVRVRAVERERGGFTLATGTDASAPPVAGLEFVAFDPVRIVVDEPAVAPLATLRGVRGAPRECPELTLADWQVDETITALPPPATIRAKTDPLQAGMSRDEVIWSRGYPNELGGNAALRSQSTWFYGRSAADAYTVTFSDDRVASVTLPESSP